VLESNFQLQTGFLCVALFLQSYLFISWSFTTPEDYVLESNFQLQTGFLCVAFFLQSYLFISWSFTTPEDYVVKKNYLLLVSLESIMPQPKAAYSQ
jgi:hypothetical protein